MIGRFDRQQRRWPQRVKHPWVGFLGDPAQRLGQIAAKLRDTEVIRAQQFMRHAVVEGHQRGATPDHRAPMAQLVCEGPRVLPYGGIDDEPCLWIAAADAEPREAADDRATQTSGFVAS